jgi:hypothetical protein
MVSSSLSNNAFGSIFYPNSKASPAKAEWVYRQFQRFFADYLLPAVTIEALILGNHKPNAAFWCSYV